ncbi:MAG: ORF6N domain-containing protein [Treponema sp.]|nr:ORF6N domain-containing protein [Treponema sp.]
MSKNKLTPKQDMIYEIRGQKVMLDSDLAKLYGLEVRVLNQVVKRNLRRFPLEFMFQLTEDEWIKQRSQYVIFNNDSRKYKPYAFTEYGILMLSSVLNTNKAIDINVQIIKIFVQMRQFAFSQNDTSDQIAELRKLLLLYIDKNDKSVNDIIIALNNLIAQPKETRKIGFRTD